MDLLAGLQDWYASQCNGDWEHQYGISLTSLDNPGWWIKIDLAGTSLQSRTFETLIENVDADHFSTADRWLHCRVENNVWHGAGDETKLPVILRAFLDWAASNR